MTKLLETALEAVRQLPPDSHDRIALAMLSLSGNEGESEEVDSAHLAGVLEGLAQAKRRHFATDAEIAAAFRRFERSSFTPRAARDRGAIADYVREKNPAAALRVRAAILESLQNLVLFPQVGRLQKVEDVRKLVTRRYPYLVHYTIDETAEEIIVITIQHPAREREHSDA
jgi:plasmid stabilization system protein ParE